MNISALSAVTTDIFSQMTILFAVFSSDHKYQGQISIRLSTWALNYAKKLSTFIDSLLISMHWIKVFQHFLCVFT